MFKRLKWLIFGGPVPGVQVFSQQLTVDSQQPEGEAMTQLPAVFCPMCGRQLYTFCGTEPYLQHPGGPGDAPSSCANAGKKYQRPVVYLKPYAQN